MAQIYKTTIDWTATGKTILGITASSPEAARDIASVLSRTAPSVNQLANPIYEQLANPIYEIAAEIYEGAADWHMLHRLHNHEALRVETRVAYENALHLSTTIKGGTV